MKRKIFTVRKFHNAASDGSRPVGEIPWNESDLVRDFSFPWENTEDSSMQFAALHDEKWLYCFFNIIDTDVKIHVATNAKQEVIFSDRVELFFSVDETLSQYYCLEVDPQGRVYDYKASFHRKFDDDWSWPSGHISIQTNFSETGYSVILSVSLESLKQFGVLNEGKIFTGIFRGKCTEVDLQNEKMRWISWVKPESERPDFHIPSAFGMFELE